MIFLAVRTPNEQEIHIKYEGHDTVESARAEITLIRERLLLDGKIPLDCFVYEADKPEYGNKAYNVDDVDFNFYVEVDPETRKKQEAQFEEVMETLKKKAEEEEKKYGSKKD